MGLIDDLRNLVGKYLPDKPAEWADYPDTEEAGRKIVLHCLATRAPFPEWVDDRDSVIWFKAGPFRRSKINNNGWMYTIYRIGWREAMHVMIDGE